MHIEVVYAERQWQIVLRIELPDLATVREGLLQSGLLKQFPNLHLDQLQLGLHSRRCGLDTVLHEGDRIEIYRPLTADPKAARRQRAQSKI